MAKKLEFDVIGMSCTSCAQNIERTLDKQDFVTQVTVNYPNKKAYVTVEHGARADEIIKLIKNAGYDALFTGSNKNEDAVFMVEGMSCSSCALTAEKTLANIPGVQSARVDFTGKKAFVTFNKLETRQQVLKEKIEEVGYSLIDIDTSDQKKEDIENSRLKDERNRLIAAWAITIPLTIKMLGEMLFGIVLVNREFAFYIDLAAAFPVIFIIGFPVLKSTLGAIRNLAFNMDSLIGIGTVAAYSTGILKLAGFDIDNFAVVGAMIMSINFIGNYLKEMATGRASQAIKQLMELGAKSAHFVNTDGTHQDVPVEQLNPGDIVLVKPGEKIPLDGSIQEGTTSIDESIATGESVPVDKKIGDQVIGGTVNQQGVIQVRVEKVGKDTFLAQIIKLVEEAQGSKIPIQAFADKVTSIFVPIVLGISLLTFLFWFIFPETGKNILLFFAPYIPWINPETGEVSLALFAAIATLVIACPCALGLATPTALMVGMGKGAQNGILIRKGEAIQTAQQIDTVIFDKTGTITKGKPTVTALKTIIPEDEFLAIAGSVEQLSEHPLAKAITAYIKDKNIPLKKADNFMAITGKGLTAEIEGKKISAGSLGYFTELQADISEFTEEIESYQNNGYTVILLSSDKKVIGILGVADEIKEDSKHAIAQLHEMGIRSVILTGDHEKSARWIAETVGIDKVYAQLLPQDKINILKQEQEKGHIVAMVGDGINDAPALKQANVGIAIGTGTDIAIESSDITLVSGSLQGVVKGIKLSQATFKKIKQNLFWAFFYNIIAVPLAILGLLHPAIAEIAMAFSSINVVLNSLRLKNISLEKKVNTN